ncbi:MAG: hypothetical protein AB1698_20655 [Pseudomonadota bacterium]
MRRPFLLLLITVPLAACQTAGSAPASWQNPSLRTEAARERQFVIDNGRCKAASMGSVPMPSGPAVVAAPASYNVSGSGYSAGSGFSTYNATLTPVQSPAGAFAGGFANGMAVRRAIDARMAQDEIYKGCMYSLGWTQSAQ